MIDESSEIIPVENFGGSATLPDATHIRFPQALIAENLEYVVGSAATRFGFGQVLASSEVTAGEVVTTMFNWISSLGNLLTWFRASTGTWRIRNITGGPVGTFQTLGVSTYAAVFANAGPRLYSVFFSALGRATTYGRVIGFQTRWTRTAGTLVSIVVASNVGTVTTSAANDFGPSALLKISGATVDTDLNGEYAVVGVTSPTIFTIATVGVADGTYTEATLAIAAYTADNFFQGPLGYVPSAPTEPGAGSITVGLHRLGYMMEFRTGFITRPSPDAGPTPPNIASFTPVEFTAAGSANLSWTLNTTWRSGAIRVHVIMSPVSNPNRYFMVPGASAVVVGGIASSVTIVWDISDEDLYATGIEVTDSLNWLTCDINDGAPFNPSVVFLNGNRMGYLTTIADNIGNQVSTIFMSDIGKYQLITADQNIIQLPGQQDMMTACCLADGATYIFGVDWTYRTRDNGQAPVTWPTPHPVSNNIGSPSIRGICPSADQSYCWVAARDGLYLLTGGAYPDLPVSYLWGPTWQRINWAVAQAVQVKDNPTTKQVFVMACLDDATVPNYRLTWDYTDGKTWNKVRATLDSIRNSSLGSMEVVQNTAPGLPASVYTKLELWLSALLDQGSTFQFLRTQSADDTHPYRDYLWNIPSHYRTALLRSSSKPLLWTHQGAHIRITGDGRVWVSAYGVDGVVVWPTGEVASNPEALIDLSETPGEDTPYWMQLLGEAVSYDFELGQNFALDPGFEDGDGSWETVSSIGAGSWAIVTDAPNAHSGTNYAKHTGANLVCDFADTDQMFTVTPGDTYFAEIWTKSTGSPDGTLSVGLEYFNSAGVSQGLISVASPTPSVAYTIASTFFTIPAGAAYIRPKLQVAGKTTGVWFVDDFFFTQADVHFKLSGIRHYLAEWAMQS